MLDPDPTIDFTNITNVGNKNYAGHTILELYDIVV